MGAEVVVFRLAPLVQHIRHLRRRDRPAIHRLDRGAAVLVGMVVGEIPERDDKKNQLGKPREADRLGVIRILSWNFQYVALIDQEKKNGERQGILRTRPGPTGTRPSIGAIIFGTDLERACRWIGSE